MGKVREKVQPCCISLLVLSQCREMGFLSRFDYLNFAIVSILLLELQQTLLNIFALEKFIWAGDRPSKKNSSHSDVHYLYLTAFIYKHKFPIYVNIQFIYFFQHAVHHHMGSNSEQQIVKLKTGLFHIAYTACNTNNSIWIFFFFFWKKELSLRKNERTYGHTKDKPTKRGSSLCKKELQPREIVFRI